MSLIRHSIFDLTVTCVMIYCCDEYNVFNMQRFSKGFFLNITAP